MKFITLCSGIIFNKIRSCEPSNIFTEIFSFLDGGPHNNSAKKMFIMIMHPYKRNLNSIKLIFGIQSFYIELSRLKIGVCRMHIIILMLWAIV